MSYKNLEIWKLADELVVEIHEMTLKKLPKFEMYEEGSQTISEIYTKQSPYRMKHYSIIFI